MTDAIYGVQGLYSPFARDLCRSCREFRIGGVEASAAVPRLTELLQDPRPSVRAAALQALVAIVTKQEEIFPILFSALSDPALARTATFRLREEDMQPLLRPHLSHLLSQAEAGLPKPVPLVDLLLLLAGIPEVRPKLVTICGYLLSHTDLNVQRQAEHILVELEPENTLILARIAARLRSGSSTLCVRALSELSQLRVAALPLLEDVCMLMNSPDANVRRGAAAVVSTSGPLPERARMCVLAMCDSQEDEVASSGFLAAVNLPPDAWTLKWLLHRVHQRELQDDNQVAWNAVEALGTLLDQLSEAPNHVLRAFEYLKEAHGEELEDWCYYLSRYPGSLSVIMGMAEGHIADLSLDQGEGLLRIARDDREAATFKSMLPTHRPE